MQWWRALAVVFATDEECMNFEEMAAMYGDDDAIDKDKRAALAALYQRREANANKPSIDNASLYAGSPMYYDCEGCNATIEVPEDWTTRPHFCPACTILKAKGWLDDAAKKA